MSLRIHRPAVATTGGNFAEWMERLVKLIPGEVAAVYTLVRGYGGDVWKNIVWPLIFLALTFVFRALITKEGSKGPQWLSAGISSVAFIFWVYITGGNFFNLSADAQIMSGLMLVFMLLVSNFWKGD